MSKDLQDKKLQGEGNYDAAREYDRGATQAAKHPEAIRRDAEAARKALDSDEAEELSQAEEKGRAPSREDLSRKRP